MLRCAVQPEIDRGHHAQIALHEQVAQPRTGGDGHSPSELRRRHRAGVHDLSGGEYDLEPAGMRGHILVQTLTDAAFQDVSNDRGVGAGSGRRGQKARSGCGEVLGEIQEGHAGFDPDCCHIRVEAQHTAHPLEREEHRLLPWRQPRPIAPIAPTRCRMNGNAEAGCDAQTRCDFVRGRWAENGDDLGWCGQCGLVGFLERH